ncbi:MAG: polysaccharide biosynthesis C-terminal domain-containing protein [Acidobacteriota bacterium]|nr:polysaccharide biosynthesis C-terminal domain-containing protein [Acidobacteriota bacterium]MDH3783726.1 polysaccharide biosynthesis C-terminal domain-containing protein [Acidobacteriota bacterium]
MSFQRDVLTTFCSRAAVLIFGVVQSVVVARYLLPEGRGQFATLMLVPQLMVVVAPLGMQWSLIYYLRQKGADRRSLLQNGLGVALLLGVLALGATLSVEYFLRDGLLAGLSLTSLLLAALIVPVRVMLGTLVGVFRGTQRIVQANILNTVWPVAQLVAVIVALVVLARGIAGMAGAILVCELLVVMWAGTMIFRGVAPRPRLQAKHVAPLVSYGLRVYLFSMLLFVNYRLDMALLRHFVDYTEVGYYATAVGLGEILWNVPTSLTFVLFPYVIGIADEERDRRTITLSRMTVAAMFVICLVFGIFARPIVTLLYTDAFLPAVFPLVVILPGILAMSIQQVLGSTLAARGRPERVTIAAAAGIVINLLLNLWWIPMYGAAGAAAASTISYSVVAGIVIIEFSRLSSHGLSDILLLKVEDIQQVVSRLRGFVREGNGDER